jgi:hypothetical protein
MTGNASAASYSLQTISGRIVRLPLTENQYGELIEHLLRRLPETGCDNTLRLSEAWAKANAIGWGRLRRGLESGGGYCDCEVAMNVVPA